ncbi:S-layer homology domain-containing protein [Lusitaniella coriacea]|uniref:S-layer homology domain-containing protein n=1 Tax=Lusitaniella coriacea TaxID=1983105 RepID=UPI003CEB9E05
MSFGCRPSVGLYLIASVLSLSVASCSNNPIAERWFAPDPELTESPATIESPQEEERVELPENFPEAIPPYPNATLLATELKSAEVGTQTRWTTVDSKDAIAQFYQKAFQKDNWKIIKPLAPTPQSKDTTLVARQDDLEVTLSLSEALEEEAESNFELNYKWDSDTAELPDAPDSDSGESPATTTAGQELTDLEEIPEATRQYVADLAKLGVFESDSTFEPNKPVTRGEFARWLVTANNLIHGNTPSKQIRLIPNPTQPAFQDIPKTHPNFAYIQGLAEAGLISSRLSGDPSVVAFRPDAPLTRENLVEWKVPLDIRQALPTGSIQLIKETWGFQDTAKIDPKALKALLADFQNGEQANVRRAFGFTTLFQPKKGVTRAEAATALWYFGYQGEGMSAENALQGKE